VRNSETAAYGMYPRSVALPDVVCALNQAGFGNEDICMVLSPAHPDAAPIRDASIFDVKGGESAISARMIGWFSEFGAVIIPTVGFFIRSQAFFRALLMEQNFPALSRGSRTLVGLGFSQDDAKRLGHELSDVGALVYVSCHEGSKADGAIELLRRTGAKEAARMASSKAPAAAAWQDFHCDPGYPAKVFSLPRQENSSPRLWFGGTAGPRRLFLSSPFRLKTLTQRTLKFANWPVSCNLDFCQLSFVCEASITLSHEPEAAVMKTHRVWIEIVVFGTAIACALALLIATLGVAAGAAAEEVVPQANSAVGEQAYEGIVTCSRCGAKHSASIGQTASVCVRVCVHGGAQFALVGADSTYLLEGNADSLKKLAGQRARVVGNLSGKTIRVASAVAES
jgi:hypothetical protein